MAKDGVVAFGNALPSCRTFSSTSQLHFAPRSTAPHPTSDWIRCLREQLQVHVCSSKLLLKTFDHFPVWGVAVISVYLACICSALRVRRLMARSIKPTFSFPSASMALSIAHLSQRMLTPFFQLCLFPLFQACNPFRQSPLQSPLPSASART